MMDPESLRRGSTAAALVTQMVVSTVLCGGFGSWLDGRFQTGPKLGLSGLLAGFALGMSTLLYFLLRRPNAEPHDPNPPAAPEE